VALYVAEGAFVQVDVTTGRSSFSSYVYFSQPDCTGSAFIVTNGWAGLGPLYGVEAYGTNRVFVPTSATPTTDFYSQSRFEPHPWTGVPTCNSAYTSGRESGYVAAEVLSRTFPLALPITLAFE
jgi:hypothetical protein